MQTVTAVDMQEPNSPPTSPQHVPYLAYKPKRHSRNFSNPTAPNSRPSSVILSPAPSQVHKMLADDDERDSITSMSLMGYGTPPTNVASGVTSPAIRIELASEELESEPSTPIYVQIERPDSTPPSTVLPDVPQLQAPVARLPEAAADSIPSKPSLLSPTQSNKAASASTSKAKKTTTFRRLAPPRATGAVTQPGTHSRNVSTSSLPPNPSSLSRDAVNPTQSRLDQVDRPRTTSLLSPTPRTPTSPLKALPTLPSDLPRLNESTSQMPPRSDSVTRTSSTMTHSTMAQSTSRTSSIPTAPSEGYASSRVTSPVQVVKPIPAPYRPGFQPKGVRRQRTDEYLETRRSKRDGEGEEGRMMRIERTKLERRLEKLIALHFLPPSAQTNGKGTPLAAGPRKRKTPDPSATVRRASSFFDLEKMRTLKLNDPGDLWRGVMGVKDTGGKEDVRAAEQRITPWEEDSSVSKCPLCSTSFHPLTNRKHHCRLCGKIMCSLPPKAPHRPIKCSLLFFVDPKTRQIEEVGEGVDYGVRRQNRMEGEDKFLKSVRICRNCRPVILRQQYSQQVEEQPVFFKLYDIFINLEKEIEDALPQFQELILSLNLNDQPTKEASSARKRLLDAFTQYDRLSKQIRAIPCPNGPGSSQDRIQASVLVRASLFLQKNMFPLQSLPRPSGKQGENGTQGKGTPVEDTLGIDPDSELALALQLLLEQEALLESFVDEAKAQRKFEDVKTLKLNQDEIRREIERLLDNADYQASTSRNGGQNSRRG